MAEDEPALVERAPLPQKAKKAPGQGRLGAPTLSLVWSWGRTRTHRLAIYAFRLGVHSRVWKCARGVPSPEPDRSDLGLAKNYRVISLNFLGKNIERVASELIDRRCSDDTALRLHPGQFGSRSGRSAIEAVAALVGLVENAWSKGRIVGALCMGVEAAIPSVALPAQKNEGGGHRRGLSRMDCGLHDRRDCLYGDRG